LVAPAYPKRLRKFIRRCSKLQDTLGEHQDACVAVELLNEFADHLRPRKLASGNRILLDLGRMIATKQKVQRRRRKEGLKLWDKFDRKKVRRDLGDLLDRSAS
jgi:CHAD domain-containing protein